MRAIVILLPLPFSLPLPLPHLFLLFFPPLFQSIVLILQNSGFKVQTLWFPLRELIDITSIVLTISGSIYCYFRKRASLVAQWQRINVPKQETWVPSLIREDPTCFRATKAVSLCSRAQEPQLLKPMHPRARAP